jgi:hypothetical protein
VLVGRTLDELRGEHGCVLHDRAIPRHDGRRSRANIDHIAVAASGVWVIDAKTHQGALEIGGRAACSAHRVERLFINGRDQTKLVEGLGPLLLAGRDGRRPVC